MILAKLPSRGCRLACDCTVHYLLLLLLLLDLTKVVCCPKRLQLPDLDRPTQQAKQLASLLAVQPACTVAACMHSPAFSSLQQFPHRALVRDLEPGAAGSWSWTATCCPRARWSMCPSTWCTGSLRPTPSLKSSCLIAGYLTVRLSGMWAHKLRAAGLTSSAAGARQAEDSLGVTAWLPAQAQSLQTGWWPCGTPARHCRRGCWGLLWCLGWPTLTPHTTCIVRDTRACAC